MEQPMQSTQNRETAGTDAESKKRGGTGSRSVTLPADVVAAFFEQKGFERGVFGGEVTYARRHNRCMHTVVTVYTSLPAKTGGDSRAVGEDAIRVTAVFSRQTPGRDRPFVKVIHKSPRVYRTGTVSGCLERAIERAREAYAAATVFLSAERCFECEKARAMSPPGKASSKGRP